jgi:hypothetical protein
MSDQVVIERFTTFLFTALEEAFEHVHGIFLDKGTSLFETLDGVSAEEASCSAAPGSATIAAQVEHVRFYLDVLGDLMRTQQIVRVDWKEIWARVHGVTPEEWDDLRRRLRESHARVMEQMREIKEWDREFDISGAVAILVHTAYHLGGIRQALAAVRSGRSIAAGGNRG